MRAHPPCGGHLGVPRVCCGQGRSKEVGAEGAFLPQSFIRIFVSLQVRRRTLAFLPLLGSRGVSGGHHPCNTSARCATRGFKAAPLKAKGLDKRVRWGMLLVVLGNRLASATCGEFGGRGAASRAKPLLDLCHCGHRTHLRSKSGRGTLRDQPTPHLMPRGQCKELRPKAGFGVGPFTFLTVGAVQCRGGGVRGVEPCRPHGHNCQQRH